MKRRFGIAAIVAMLMAVGFAELAIVIQPSGTAQADVCASAGRRVRVGGCWDVGGAIANYAPPPAYYAPLPEDYPPPPPPP